MKSFIKIVEEENKKYRWVLEKIRMLKLEQSTDTLSVSKCRNSFQYNRLERTESGLKKHYLKKDQVMIAKRCI